MSSPANLREFRLQFLLCDLHTHDSIFPANGKFLYEATIYVCARDMKLTDSD